MDDPLPINQMAGIFSIYAINDRARTAPLDKAMEEQGCLYFGPGPARHQHSGSAGAANRRAAQPWAVPYRDAGQLRFS